MSDGRSFSSWQPEAVVNQKIQQEAGIDSNWKYRQYLQKNASQIMKYNTTEYVYASGNNPYIFGQGQPMSKTPVRFSNIHDNSKPFGQSDLKKSYLTREQLNARMVAPTINLNQFWKFTPFLI